MSVVEHRPSPLSSTGLCFTRHGASVTKLSKSSLHAPSCPWSVSVPCIFPERVERNMRVVQRLSVLQATWSALFHWSLCIVFLISRALVFLIEHKTRKLIFLWIFDQSSPHSSFNQGNPRPNNRMQVLSWFPSNFEKSTILLSELFRCSVIVTGFKKASKLWKISEFSSPSTEASPRTNLFSCGNYF